VTAQSFRRTLHTRRMSKRTLSDLLNEEQADSHGEKPSSSPPRPHTRARFSSPQAAIRGPLRLSYPNISQPAKQTPFQQPIQIISFSYTPSRVLEFTDSALRYFVDPPLGAKLGHAYDRWVKRPEERGRIDGLVKAFSKARSGEAAISLRDVGVVAWRGVMTKYVTCCRRQ
jgi:RAT1-interacting protein